MLLGPREHYSQSKNPIILQAIVTCERSHTLVCVMVKIYFLTTLLTRICKWTLESNKIFSVDFFWLLWLRSSMSPLWCPRRPLVRSWLQWSFPYRIWRALIGIKYRFLNFAGCCLLSVTYVNKYILLLKENCEKICYRIYIWHFLKKIGCFLNQNYNSALVDRGNKVEHIVTAPSQKGDDSTKPSLILLRLT